MWAGIIYASGTLLTNAFLSALQTSKDDIDLKDFKRKYEAFIYFTDDNSFSVTPVERYRAYLTKAFGGKLDDSNALLGDTNQPPMPDNYREIYGPKVALKMARALLIGGEKIEDEILKQMMMSIDTEHDFLHLVVFMLKHKNWFEFLEFAAQRCDYVQTFRYNQEYISINDFFVKVMEQHINTNRIPTQSHDPNNTQTDKVQRMLGEEFREQMKSEHNRGVLNKLDELLYIQLRKIGYDIPGPLAREDNQKQQRELKNLLEYASCRDMKKMWTDKYPNRDFKELKIYKIVIRAYMDNSRDMGIVYHESLLAMTIKVARAITGDITSTSIELFNQLLSEGGDTLLYLVMNLIDEYIEYETLMAACEIQVCTESRFEINREGPHTAWEKYKSVKTQHYSNHYKLKTVIAKIPPNFSFDDFNIPDFIARRDKLYVCLDKMVENNLKQHERAHTHQNE
jgi:hypothetical protein